MRITYLFCSIFAVLFSLNGAEVLPHKTLEVNMENVIKKYFPQTEVIKADEVEQQYLVSAGKDRFWLAVPTGKPLNSLHFVIVFSGRGGTGKDNNISAEGIRGDFRRKMLSAGFAFICAECSPEAWGDPESTRATLAALEYCRKQGVAIPEKIDLLGFSMGGLGALMFAARQPEKVNRIVDVFGITDLEEFYKKGKYRAKLGEIPEAERLDRSPCAKVERYKNMEILIIHGDKDEIVDISFSQRFYELLKKHNVPSRFVVIPDMGHSNNILGKIDTLIPDFFSKK